MLPLAALSQALAVIIQWEEAALMISTSGAIFQVPVIFAICPASLEIFPVRAIEEADAWNLLPRACDLYHHIAAADRYTNAGNKRCQIRGEE